MEMRQKECEHNEREHISLGNSLSEDYYIKYNQALPKNPNGRTSIHLNVNVRIALPKSG